MPTARGFRKTLGRARIAGIPENLPSGPVQSAISATVTQTSASVTWTTDTVTQGWFEWGLTSSYGNETAHETSFSYSTHVQSVNSAGVPAVLLSGTLYHYRIHSVNASGYTTVSADQTFATTALAVGTFGPGFAVGTKDNLRIGDTVARIVAHKFKAPSTGSLQSVHWTVRWGSGYSSAAGTQPVIKVAVQADSAGSPSGTDLGSDTVTFAALTSAGGGTLRTTFDSPVAVTAGSWYWIVYSNAGGSPTTVYLSVNQVNPFDTYNAGGLSPVCPAYPDGEWTVKHKLGAGAWTAEDDFRATLGLTYVGGSQFGQPFLGTTGNALTSVAGGAYRFRERIIVPAGENVDVTAFHFRVSKLAGTTGALTVTLQNAAFGTIDTVDIAAADVEDNYSCEAGGTNCSVGGPNVVSDCGDWETLTLGATRTLTAGSTYYLLFTAPAGSTYYTVGMRNFEFHSPNPPLTGMDFAYLSGTLGTSGYSRLEVSTNSGSSYAPVYAYGDTLPQMSWYAEAV